MLTNPRGGRIALRALSAAAALAVVRAGQDAAQSPPQWRATVPQEISSFAVTPIGNVLVVMRDQLVAVDPATGATSWSLPNLHGMQDGWWLSIVPETPYGLLDLGDVLELIDLQTGTKRWTTGALAITTLKGFLAVPERHLVLVYGTSTPDSSVLMALDIDSGTVRWQHANPFTVAAKRYRALTDDDTKTGRSLAGEQPALWVTDTTFLLYVSEDGPVLVNARTGAFLWRAESLKGKRPPALRDLYPPITIAESVAYVPSEKDLHAIRLRDGTPLWHQPASLPSRIMQLDLTPTGVLVRGTRRPNDALRDGSFVDLLDPVTGASRWPKQFKRGWSVFHPNDAPALFSPYAVHRGRVYVVTEDKLYGLTLDKGESAELGKIKFKSDEHPVVVEDRPDGVLLLSAQNVLLVDTTGTPHWQHYYPAPPISLLGHIATVFLRLTLDGISEELAEDEAKRTGVPQTYTQYDNPFLRLRYTAADTARDYVYFLTSDKDSTGTTRSSIVKVSKDRDRVEGRVWLSDKAPTFVIDPIAATAYVQTGPEEIVALKF